MFPWYICFSKRLGWSKLRNDIDLPLFAILLGLLIINHSSSERRSIFVLGWLKLSRILVVLQLAWVRTSLYLSWITRSGLVLCLVLDRVSGNCGIVSNGSCWFGCVHQYTSGLKVLACSIDTDFNYVIIKVPESPPPPPPSPLCFENL